MVRAWADKVKTLAVALALQPYQFGAPVNTPFYSIADEEVHHLACTQITCGVLRGVFEFLSPLLPFLRHLSLFRSLWHRPSLLSPGLSRTS